MSLLSVRNYLISALVVDAKKSGTDLDTILNDIRRTFESDTISPVEIVQTKETAAPAKKEKKEKKEKKPRKPRTPSDLDRFKKAHRDEHSETLKKMAESGTLTIKSKKGDKDLSILTKKGGIKMTTVSSYMAKLWDKMSTEERDPYTLTNYNKLYGSDTESESDNNSS